MSATSLIHIPTRNSEGLWNVVVETPRGVRHKFKYDPKLHVFSLHHTLPEGMAFPYDFGFLPGTAGEDGDPLDVLLLLRDATFCGCVVPAHLVGVIEAKQREKDGEKERNDRLVAIPDSLRDRDQTRSAKELNPTILKEVEAFFKNYNALDGKQFEVLAVRGPKAAETLVREGMRKFRRRSGK
ncbi:MAG TPA: inorganic diphosphatase [Phycisphaerae bacterium]|nr:inorganic diphosphatase [Phycisphaerae bacterium]